MDLAQAMQEAIMPDERPVRRAGFQLRGAFRPVAECGGDMWAWHELDQHRVLLFIGDATGHGAAPAMLTAVAKGTIEAARLTFGDQIQPGELLRHLNRAIHRAGRTRYLMTGFACVLDTRSGELVCANAGHNFPYIVTRGEGGRAKLESLIARGNTLGTVAEASFTTLTRTLSPGDKLVMYSDGIIDAGAPAHEPYGEKRLRAALLGMIDLPAARLCEVLMTEVEAFLAGRSTADDMTLLCAERLVEGPLPAAPVADFDDGGRA
jgi:sigma-B regulation protein RsbU (phosphoserine phosphatase)